ncbi:hypothetical protein Q7P37_003228 [Cladosporium fusiforme]
MCIALLSTAHPDYPLVLLSNRDEFLDRPTAPAHWWQAPHSHVLGGRDLQRPEQGTWLALTKDGRIAILTNFREEGQEISKEKSRGAMVSAYLARPAGEKESDAEFARRLVEDVGIDDVGGFSLVFGHLQQPPSPGQAWGGLSVLSNRTTDPSNLAQIAAKPGEVQGLSNSHFGDISWPKIVYGEQFLRQAVDSSVSRHDSQEKFIASLFDVLSVDTFPKLPRGEEFAVYASQMRNSIFIPRVGGEGVRGESSDGLKSAREDGVEGHAGVLVGPGAGGYGTQKQTVVLVHRSGKVTFVERSLYDEHARETESERRFEFQIEPWSG